jgi:Rrf2 family transcriptional regulator, nitric oxide-sensitive transcriptional repressor
MRLTTFTDYGLRVLIYLGSYDGGQTKIADIAASFGISENHLVKVVHFLGQAGFIETLRGRSGGIRLAAAPDAINVADVVRLAEGLDIPVECFDPETNTCGIAKNCRLRGVLGEALDAFYAVLENYTLQDLVRNRQVLGKILFRAPASAGRARPG